MFSRTERLIGRESLEKLKNKRVAVFGLGGVGGYVVEALVRGGVGALLLVDKDSIDISNLNRQIIALQSNIGKYKTEVAKARVLDINPACNVETRTIFYLPENADTFDFSSLDYIVDAVDTVSAKISLIEQAKKRDIPIISCMGTGNKLNPKAFEVADISETNVCPLARVMRRELKKRGVEHVNVLYSKEEPKKTNTSGEKMAPSSISFVPPVAGLIIAGEVIKDLIK